MGFSRRGLFFFRVLVVIGVDNLLFSFILFVNIENVVIIVFYMIFKLLEYIYVNFIYFYNINIKCY